MTLVESPDNQFSTHSPSDARPRPHFLSSKPTLWLKTASMESLSSPKKTRVSNSSKSVSPALKTRHSTSGLSPLPDPPPTPNPPQRPLRNPARRVSGLPTKPKAKKRPSTATGAPEQVVPWTASSNGNTPTTNVYGTISSPVSTHSRSSLAGTGPIEVVTPWELYPVPGTTSRHTLSTGPTEEVTPWELYPVSAPKRKRSSLATGLVEDVTPWELFPVSIPEEPVKSNGRHTRLSVSRIDLVLSYRIIYLYGRVPCFLMIYVTCATFHSLLFAMMLTFYSHYTHAVPPFQSRPSTSSGQGKSSSDLAQIRKLKHTSGKVSKSRSNTLPSAQSSAQGSAAGHIKGAGSSSSVPTSPKASSTATSETLRPSTSSQNPQFSTADRTILEELKRNISARAAQFTVKGAGAVDGHGISTGKKHHPYRREEVPYPRSYDREVLDLYVAYLYSHTTLISDGGVGTSGKLSSVKISVKASPGTYFKSHQRKCNVYSKCLCLTILTCKIRSGWTLAVVSGNLFAAEPRLCCRCRHRYMDFEQCKIMEGS
jgi:hypothetical protein